MQEDAAMKNIRVSVEVASVVVLAVIVVTLVVFNRPRKIGTPMPPCIVNLRQIATAMHMYSDDYDSRLPDPSITAVWGHGTRRGWTEKLCPSYLKTAERFQCPERDVNFAYAMNDRLTTNKVKRPSRCIFVYECPGSGDSTVFPLRLDKDNWRDAKGREISWATGNAGLSGSSMRKVSSVQKFAELCYTPRNLAEARKKPTEDCSELTIPSLHGIGAPVVFCDGHTGYFTENKEPWMTFDPDKEKFPDDGDANSR